MFRPLYFSSSSAYVVNSIIYMNSNFLSTICILNIRPNFYLSIFQLINKAYIYNLIITIRIIDQINMNVQIQLSANYFYLVPSSIASLALLIGLIVYLKYYKHRCSSVLKVIALLLANELIESLFQSLGYIGSVNNVICQISIIGKACFTIAANFWIIFVTRLLYLQKLKPGKYFNLVVFVGKNVLLTYTPSLIVSVFLVIMININSTQSEDHCWRVITNKELLDYVIYYTCFVLPNFLAMVVVGIYLFLYMRMQKSIMTIFLVFPIVSLIFGLYYISIKIYMFLQEQDRIDNIEIPLILQPILYLITFGYLIHSNLKLKQRQNSSQYTIKDQSIEGSFIQDF